MTHNDLYGEWYDSFICKKTPRRVLYLVLVLMQQGPTDVWVVDPHICCTAHCPTCIVSRRIIHLIKHMHKKILIIEISRLKLRPYCTLTLHSPKRTTPKTLQKVVHVSYAVLTYVPAFIVEFKEAQCCIWAEAFKYVIDTGDNCGAHMTRFTHY